MRNVPHNEAEFRYYNISQNVIISIFHNIFHNIANNYNFVYMQSWMIFWRYTLIYKSSFWNDENREGYSLTSCLARPIIYFSLRRAPTLWPWTHSQSSKSPWKFTAGISRKGFKYNKTDIVQNLIVPLNLEACFKQVIKLKTHHT